MYQEAFNVTYIDTEGDSDFYNFYDKHQDYCLNDAYEYPWSYGSYQLYEMDEERHSYKFLTFVNLTESFSKQLYPQFMIESVMKNAMEDDDFEMKVRSTPFPMPAEVEGKYFTSLQMELISDALSPVAYWPGQSLAINIILSSTWIIINSFTVISVMRERLSQRKHF